MNDTVQSSQVRINPFRVAHLNRVLEIEYAAFPEEPYSNEMFLELLNECGDLFVVAKRSRRIVGYMVTCKRRRRAEVISIAVDEEQRGSGVGTALMQYTIRRLRRAGILRIELMVRKTSRRAVRFYENLGFTRVGTAVKYYQNGGDAYSMVKAL